MGGGGGGQTKIYCILGRAQELKTVAPACTGLCNFNFRSKFNIVHGGLLKRES